MIALGLLIAAPRSGSGKTTLTLGLMRALRRRGVEVAGVKSGPDYIDPAFHQAALGRDSLNLDSWAMDEDLLASLAAQACAGADLLLAEASMGLFDGVPAPTGRSGASADIAATLGLPVLLALDASGQAQSAGAVAKGCASYDPRLRVAGVVLNRIGSERHLRLAREGVEAVGLKVVGALPKKADVVLPERHLGLVQATETAELERRLEALADFVEAHVDLDAVLALAAPVAPTRSPQPVERQASPTPHSPSLDGRFQRPMGDRPPHHSPFGRTGVSRRPMGEGDSSRAPRVALAPPGQKISIARDAAFSFLYPHLLAGWRARGAEMTFFSPLADEAPPPDADCLWLPGGYPELHAGRLAANLHFLNGLRAFAREKPVHGECGGYMVLGESLTGSDGTVHPMAGLLSVRTSFAKRKMTLGYRDATLLADCALGRKGQRFRGHEFHYASIVALGEDAPMALASDAYGGAPAPAGLRRGLVSGSFFHCVAEVV